MFKLPKSLTTQLTVTLVILVSLSTLFIGLLSAVLMKDYLTDRLDQQLNMALNRGGGKWGPRSSNKPDDDFHRDDHKPNVLPQAPGTLIVSGSLNTGVLLANGEFNQLSISELAKLNEVATNRDIKTIKIADYGNYRVASGISPSGEKQIIGLPLFEVDRAFNRLLFTVLSLSALALLITSYLGRLLIRNNLRSLRKVADTATKVSQMPLAEGDLIPLRVPATFTNPENEVGQVGAALNRLLSEMENALKLRSESEDRIRQFVADASHELRTPLATIKGYSELARRNPKAAELQLQSLAKVETEADRMAHLVNDLLLLARLDSGRPLARTEFDLSQLLVEAINDARILDPDKNWLIQLPKTPITFIGDPDRMQQSVSNLLSNARQHTPAGTEVSITAATSATAITITVADNGPGVPTKLRQEVFERFTRGDSSRTRASGGAGLGLSLAKAIVEAHHGSLTLDNQNVGTQITMKLPRQPPELA